MTIPGIRRRFLVCGALAVSVAMASLPMTVDGAAEPVNLAYCNFHGGTATVPAGTVSLRLPGFAEGTYGLMEDFLLKERTALSVTAGGTTSVVDLTDAWSDPAQLDTLLWLSRPPDYDLGTLSIGESVVVVETISFVHPLLLAYPPSGGTYLLSSDGPLTCTITATS